MAADLTLTGSEWERLLEHGTWPVSVTDAEAWVSYRPDGCICTNFRDTGGFRIADLACPLHGVDGPAELVGDAPWERVPLSGRQNIYIECDKCHGTTDRYSAGLMRWMDCSEFKDGCSKGVRLVGSAVVEAVIDSEKVRPAISRWINKPFIRRGSTGRVVFLFVPAEQYQDLDLSPDRKVVVVLTNPEAHDGTPGTYSSQHPPTTKGRTMTIIDETYEAVREQAAQAIASTSGRTGRISSPDDTDYAHAEHVARQVVKRLYGIELPIDHRPHLHGATR